MKSLVTLWLIVLFTSIAEAQVVTLDTIFTFKGIVNDGKIKTGTDTLVSFIESEGIKDKISENIRTIELVNNQYRITTYNFLSSSEEVTKVEAFLDAEDLHIQSFYLKTKNDSASARYKNGQIRGWLKIPQQDKRIINFTYQGNTFLSDGNTPWLIGLLELQQNQTIIIPVFHLFSNSLHWRSYTVLGEEPVILQGNSYTCWKVDAGPQGPPGFNAFHWYDKNSGQLLRVELAKEGENAKYVSELKNIR